jgi:exodeoxyribonuclease V beta subunit
MRQAHYPLQALLYYVALHRFLRWRQPAYDPDRHLGGALYLFLRGMCGDDDADGADGHAGSGSGGDGATDPPGVWSWRPPAGLVVALSGLLAGGAP